ncbi:hypothetical protein LGM81_05560 [Burkholderia multivorans]|nr:hypothetical protein [Burkholderia multivorans]
MIPKTIAFGALISLSGIAWSATSFECSIVASMYNYAASYRDTGISPQDTSAKIKDMFPSRQKFLKGVVNQVYFDPDVSQLSAHEIVSSVMHECINPSKAKSFSPVE